VDAGVGSSRVVAPYEALGMAAAASGSADDLNYGTWAASSASGTTWFLLKRRRLKKTS